MLRILSIMTLAAAIAVTAKATPPEAPPGFRWEPDPRFTDEFNGESLDTDKWHDHHPRWRGRVKIKSLASNVGAVEKVALLTSDQPLMHRHDQTGLHVICLKPTPETTRLPW